MILTLTVLTVPWMQSLRVDLEEKQHCSFRKHDLLTELLWLDWFIIEAILILHQNPSSKPALQVCCLTWACFTLRKEFSAAKSFPWQAHRTSSGRVELLALMWAAWAAWGAFPRTATVLHHWEHWVEEVSHNPIAGKLGLLLAFASSLTALREQLPQLSSLDLAGLVLQWWSQDTGNKIFFARFAPQGRKQIHPAQG